MKLVSLRNFNSNFNQDTKALLRPCSFLPSNPCSVAGEERGGALCCQVKCALAGCSRSAPARYPSSFACRYLDTQTRSIHDAALACSKKFPVRSRVSYLRGLPQWRYWGRRASCSPRHCTRLMGPNSSAGLWCDARGCGPRARCTALE